MMWNMLPMSEDHLIQSVQELEKVDGLITSIMLMGIEGGGSMIGKSEI